MSAMKSTQNAPDPALRSHDLLADPIFTVRLGGQRSSLSLPEILARLGAGDELEFAALRSHQHHAWHAFLVQLAALVAESRDRRGLDLSAAEWRRSLLDLAGEAGGDDEAAAAAWRLVVGDPALPAFFQTPAPEGSLAPYKKEIPTPDELDVVVTTRNHDVKQERMTDPDPEHWAYALLTLQTMEGFLGRGNYGIARMNGGFSNRPCLALAPDLTWAARFRRDVQVWLDSRERLLEIYTETDGRSLLWVWPWDGEKTSKLALSACDPFFIEVCRRIRLVPDGHGSLVARMAATKDYLLDGAALQGDTGDVWTPIKADGSALTVSGRGFHYKLLSQLIFGQDFHRNPALEVRQEDRGEPVLVAQTLVRGQGLTEGYHERVIPMPAKVIDRLALDPEILGGRAKTQISLSDTVRRKVLHPALCALLQKGADQLNFRDDRTGPWLSALDRAVDDTFFPHLWATVEDEEEEFQASWQRLLKGLARDQFHDAQQSVPMASAHRARSQAKAELRLRRLLRQHLELAFPPKTPQPEATPPDSTLPETPQPEETVSDAA